MPKPSAKAFKAIGSCRSDRSLAGFVPTEGTFRLATPAEAMAVSAQAARRAACGADEGEGRTDLVCSQPRQRGKHAGAVTRYPGTDSGLLGAKEVPQSNAPSLNFRGSLVAGTLAAIGASVCCVGPLVLLALGIGGAWVSSLTALEPLRPLFVAGTLVFLGLAFRRLYLQPWGCESESQCAQARALERQRLIFCLVAGALIVLLSVPSLAPLFY